MKTSDGILMIEPSAKISDAPIIDELTRKMTAAWRRRKESDYSYRGIHRCACGVISDNRDHFIGENDILTNSLCVHYLAFHRAEISKEELEKIKNLSCGEEEPNEKELAITRR